MHAVYIACIYQIYIVFKEYGDCVNSREILKRNCNFSFSLFLLISSLKRGKGHFLSNLCSTNCFSSFSEMGTKMKGIYKAGFKYLSNIFVVKERELEIGFPTDIKHVAHIGWEGSSGSAPTWMKEFKTGPTFATTRIGNNGSSLSPWSSQEGNKGDDEVGKKDKITSSELINIPNPKKNRKKSSRSSNSSSKSGGSSSKSGSSSSSSRALKSKAKFVDGGNNKLAAIKIEAKSIAIEVA